MMPAPSVSVALCCVLHVQWMLKDGPVLEGLPEMCLMTSNTVAACSVVIPLRGQLFMIILYSDHFNPHNGDVNEKNPSVNIISFFLLYFQERWVANGPLLMR